MTKEKIVSFLEELRDCKYCVASSVLKRSYFLALSGSAKESCSVREQALKELQQVFVLERWIDRLGGILPVLKDGNHTSEIEGREKLLRLVRQNLPPAKSSVDIDELRAFLLKLAQEEKAKIESLRSRAPDCA